MIVGLGMLLSLRLWRFPLFRKIAMPPVLWPWPVVITILSGIDMYTVFFPVSRFFYRTMGIYMSEVTEMLIGLAAFLYVALNLRQSPSKSRIRRMTRGSSSEPPTLAL